MRHDGMTTSGASLRKLPTLWLDSCDDKNDAGAVADAPSEPLPKNTSKNDWETIMGKVSRDTSPERNERRERTLGIQREREQKDRIQSPAQHDGARIRRSPSTSKPNESVNQVSSFWSSAYVSYAELGAGRLIGDCGLLILRLLILSALGILFGVSFAVRDTVPATSLLTEQFMWLHVLHLVLIPFLSLASLMAANSPADDFEEEKQQVGGSQWIIVGIASHVANTFSQAELVRLFVLHAVPSLQPFNATFGANRVFSLSSVFAVQRYLMAGFSITELIFSKLRHHFVHTVIVFFLATCWELCMYRIRVLEKSVGERIGLLIGSVALAINLSALNVITRKALEVCTPEPSQKEEDLHGVMEIL